MQNKTMGLRFRFWFEAAMAAITGCLLLITMVWPHWIETVFGLSPDGGDGSLEWLIISGMVLVTLAFTFMAHCEWRAAKSNLGLESPL